MGIIISIQRSYGRTVQLQFENMDSEATYL